MTHLLWSLAGYIWLIYCLITRDLLRGENSPSIFPWNVPLVSVILLKRSLVLPILFLFYIALHRSLRKAFLFLFAILWNSAFKWVYFSFSPLPLASLLPFFQSFLLCPCTHLTPYKVMFQARLQQYMNCELPDAQAGFRKGREPEIKLSTSVGSSKKQKNTRKTSTSTLLIMPSLWLSRSQQTVENSSRDGNNRPPYLPTEKSVWRSRSNIRAGHGTTDLFQTWKGVCQGCILSPCLFNLYNAESV